MQGLVATNPEDDSKMDVVGVVPSVPFEPGTDLYRRMLSEHRREDDEHSKGLCAKKVTHSLEPHQPGMAKTGEVHTRLSG